MQISVEGNQEIDDCLASSGDDIDNHNESVIRCKPNTRPFDHRNDVVYALS